MRLLPALLAAGTLLMTATPAHAWQVTWLGHAGFLVEARDGTRVLIDPWLGGPTYPKGYQLPEKIDAILVSHGHFDHASSATELSKRFKAPVVGVFELASLLKPEGGPEPIGGNIGGTFQIKGIKASLIPAVHSSSTAGENGKPQYAGCPGGFILEAEGEPTLLHAGDTGLTKDYEAVGKTFKPKVAMLPIGGHFTMDPKQAAVAASYLGVKDVIPMHYGTFGLLKGTPAALREAGPGLRVHALKIGEAASIK